ncbi:MAG: hypothetical protein ACXVCI_14715 [Bdellovibrionota bacterium]
MRNVVIALSLIAGFTMSSLARADNALTADQLMKSIQNAAGAYERADPVMSKSISGFRVVTMGANAQVTIEMKADNMNMSAKFLCVAQGQDMVCRQQQ